MKYGMGIIVCCLALGGSLWGEGRWGVGVETEGRWFNGSLEGAGARISGSGEFRLGGPLWLGLRASLGVIGPGGLWYLAPRANLALGWEFDPDLTIELEAPYSPGLGVLVGGHWYFWVGTDELIVPRDYVTRGAAVEYRF